MGYLPDYNEHGLLPVGRWQASTPDDIASKYIPSGDVCREDLWSAWVDTTGILRAAFGEVIACWLSGSFFSTKPDPRDIDCLYIISHDTFANPVDSELAATVRKMRDQQGYPVDIQILEFYPYYGDAPTANEKEYALYRGIWDDFWSKHRDKTLLLHSQAQQDKQSAYPSRGYLEVILDGYPKPAQ